MIFTSSGRVLRVVVGLDGGCYVTEWLDELERRHGTPHWRVRPRDICTRNHSPIGEGFESAPAA